MVVRGNSLAAGMSQYLVEQIRQTANIHVELNSQVTEVSGTDRVEELSILCSTSRETQKVPAASLFIFIGAAPGTNWLHDAVQRDEKGFIVTGSDLIKAGKAPKGWPLEREPWLLEASAPGIFAAGDVRYGSIKRVASGVGEGANAVQFVHQYLGSV
jgi:thioredoxin reductase (NADPH)